MLSTLIDYLGRFHLVVIHFPIALLIVAALGELWGVWYPSRRLADFVTLAMGIGAAATVAAVATGWLFALQIHRPPEQQALLSWHRWLGVGALPLTLITALVSSVRSHSTQRAQCWWRRGFIWTTALLIALVAHLGGAIAWGSDFFE